MTGNVPTKRHLEQHRNLSGGSREHQEKAKDQSVSKDESRNPKGKPETGLESSTATVSLGQGLMTRPGLKWCPEPWAQLCEPGRVVCV